MVDFMAAIQKPFSDPKTLGIGAILGAIPLVSLLVSGYAIKTAEDVINKKNNLRSWAISDIGEYIIKVIMYLIISIVYMIIPGIVIVFGVGGAVLTAMSSYATNPTAIMTAIGNSLMVGAPIILVGLVLMLIAAILIPVAIMKWLKAGSIGAAFNIIAVIKSAISMSYLVAILVIIVYTIALMLVAGIISIILLFIPIIGVLLYMVLMGGVMFALSVTAYTILAQSIN